MQRLFINEFKEEENMATGTFLAIASIPVVTILALKKFGVL